MSLPKKYLFWIQFPDQDREEIAPFEMVIDKGTSFEEFLFAACKNYLTEEDGDGEMYNYPVLILTGCKMKDGDKETKIHRLISNMPDVLEEMDTKWLCLWNVVERSDWIAWVNRRDARIQAKAKAKAAATSSTASSSSLP